MANPCSMFDLQDVARVFYPPPPAEATALAASADRYEPLSVGAALPPERAWPAPRPAYRVGEGRWILPTAISRVLSARRCW